MCFVEKYFSSLILLTKYVLVKFITDTIAVICISVLACVEFSANFNHLFLGVDKLNSSHKNTQRFFPS